MSAEEEKIAAEMQADLLAGTLELDPENDPVLGTTANGLEIKFHGKSLTGNWDYTKFTTGYPEDVFTGKGTFYNLSGYLYFTFGSYNWVVIGRNSNLNAISVTNTYAQGTATPAEFIKFASYSTYANALKGQTETTTDAGSAINSAHSNGILNSVSSAKGTFSFNLSSYNVISSADLNNYPGCVLCLCADITGSSYFDNTSPYYSYYPNSDLDTAMTNVYNNIKSAAGNAIQSTSLKTYCYNGSSFTTYTHSEYLFPLGFENRDRAQNFLVDTYLDTFAKRDINTAWWLRSVDSSDSYMTYQITTDGSIVGAGVNISRGVRPAFVLKIT